MIVYRTITNPQSTIDLRQKSEGLVKHLFPNGNVAHLETDGNRSRTILRDGKALIGFELFNCKVGEEGLEWILRFATDLEAMRKKQSVASAQEIALCLLATGFSQRFMERIRKGMVPLQLFDWSLIRSNNEEALLLHQVFPELKEVKFSPSHRSGEFKPDTQVEHVAPDRLSTPERLAFERFRKELVTRRGQTRGLSLKRQTP